MIYLAKAGETLLFAWFAKNEAFLGGFHKYCALLFDGHSILWNKHIQRRWHMALVIKKVKREEPRPKRLNQAKPKWVWSIT